MAPELQNIAVSIHQLARHRISAFCITIVNDEENLEKALQGKLPFLSIPDPILTEGLHTQAPLKDIHVIITDNSLDLTSKSIAAVNTCYSLLIHGSNEQQEYLPLKIPSSRVYGKYSPEKKEIFLQPLANIILETLGSHFPATSPHNPIFSRTSSCINLLWKTNSLAPLLCPPIPSPPSFSWNSESPTTTTPASATSTDSQATTIFH